MKTIQIETDVDLTDLMGQVFRVADYSVVMDLMLDSLEEDHSCPIATVFPRKCKKLIEQITKRVERHTYVAGDEEEEEEED